MMIYLEVACGFLGLVLYLSYARRAVHRELQSSREAVRHALAQHIEVCVERACRHVLQAHETRFHPRCDMTQLPIRFMDRSERRMIDEITIPAWQRRPVLEHQDHCYTAARQEGNTWIYRQR